MYPVCAGSASSVTFDVPASVPESEHENAAESLPGDEWEVRRQFKSQLDLLALIRWWSTWT